MQISPSGEYFNRIGDKVGNNLGDAILIRKDDWEFFGKVYSDGVLVGLCPETLGLTFYQGWERDIR